MEVVNIKQKNRNTTNCIVSFIDEQSSTDNSTFDVELSMDIVVKEHLIKGKVIDDTNWKKIQSAQRLIDAKQMAYNYAAKANKTQKQVVQKLQLQGFCNTEIDAAIYFLKEFNLIDDSLFAKRYIKDTLLTKNIGRTGLLTKLISKGVDKQVAANSIELYYPDDTTATMINDIVHKKLCSSNYKKKTPNKIKISIFNHILAKGFTFDDAKKAVELAMQTIKNNN